MSITRNCPIPSDRRRRLYLVGSLLATALLCGTSLAQNSGRATIGGRVLDPDGAIVPGAAVTVTDTDTGVSRTVQSNQTGYYEVGELLPGPYQVKVQAAGFKSEVRNGITLVTGATETADLIVSVGSIAETVTVEADVLQLNTSSGSNGQVLEREVLESAPANGENIDSLIKLSSNITSTNLGGMNGTAYQVALNSVMGTSGQNNKNEFSLNGAPNQISNHQASYTPSTDEVNEVRTDTSGFDASVGKTLGINIVETTKNGTNQFHGTIKELYESQRWQAFNHFQRVNYIANVIPACAAGPSANCTQQKNNFGQPGLHENNYGATIGGPITVPHLFKGKDKLFFFFAFSGDSYANTLVQTRSVPTALERGGNFSDLPGYTTATTGSGACATYNAYQIFDPFTVATAPCRTGTHYARSPFAGNNIPAGRLRNPLNAFVNAEYPLPNNGDPNTGGVTGLNGQSNYVYNMTQPQNYHSFSERIDYTPTQNDRFFVSASKWHYHQTINGFLVGNLDAQVNDRDNFIFTGGYVRNLGSNTVLTLAAGYNRYYVKSAYPNELANPPDTLGFPSYLGAQAALTGFNELPIINPSGYGTFGASGSYPAYAKVISVNAGLEHVMGRHSIKLGADFRQQVTSGQQGPTSGPGNPNSSGLFNFDNAYTRQYDDNQGSPQTLGLSYAAFLLGVQTSATLDNNSFFVRSSPYTSYFVQDTWRVKPRLTINAGIRFEYEWGPREKSNRQIGYWDPSQNLGSFATGTSAAYATNLGTYKTAFAAIQPSPGLPPPPASLAVIGGPVFAGANGISNQQWDNTYRVLPRVALAFQPSAKTVIRGGAGLFYDTNNALNNTADQSGFSVTTTDSSSSNFGQTWNSSKVNSSTPPITDPFYTQSNGANFLSPVGNTIGNLSKAGTNWTYTPFNYRPARQYRYQASFGWQVSSKSVLTVEYIGSWTTHLPVVKDLNSVPAAYYTGGNVLNPYQSSYTSNVPNPFNVSNFGSLQSSNPAAYNYVVTNGGAFFTSPSISLINLTKPNPQMAGLLVNSMLGQSKFNEASITYNRRLSQGLSLNVNYQRIFQYDRDYFANPFDPMPSWEPSNNTTPSRLNITAVYQLPFGRGQAFANHGVMSAAFGGFTLSSSISIAQGFLINFPNLIFNGTDPKSIKKNGINYAQAFDTSQFDTILNDPSASSKQLGAYNLRVFPTRVDGVRQEGLANYNANFERVIPILEHLRLTARIECFNLFNRSVVGPPNVTPTSTNLDRSRPPTAQLATSPSWAS